MSIEKIDQIGRAGPNSDVGGAVVSPLGFRSLAATRACGESGVASPAEEATDTVSLSAAAESPLQFTRTVSKEGPKASDRARRQAVRTSLQTGQPVSFRSELGTRHTLQVTSAPSRDGDKVYSVALDGTPIQVSLPEESGRQANTLARIADYAAETPRGLRPALKTVDVEAGANPADEYWARQYGMPGFVSAATGGGGNITFWHGDDYLGRGTFNHEMGHLVGGALNQRSANPQRGANGEVLSVPQGWPSAAAEDHRRVSSYGSVHINEDFAESWTRFQAARRAGPKALRSFTRAFPHRVALLQAVRRESLA